MPEAKETITAHESAAGYVCIQRRTTNGPTMGKRYLSKREPMPIRIIFIHPPSRIPREKVGGFILFFSSKGVRSFFRRAVTIMKSKSLESFFITSAIAISAPPIKGSYAVVKTYMMGLDLRTSDILCFIYGIR